jgi:hypothetical protein
MTAARYNKEDLLDKWPEETRMRVCMLFLRCDKLEKKIKGISKLKDIAERTIKEAYVNFTVESFNEGLQSLKVF